MKQSSKCIVLCLTLLLNGPLWSQPDQATTDFVTVRSIQIKGNKKTKEALIERELDFGPGDTLSISTLATRLEKNEGLLMNTGLFNSSKINIETWDTDLHAIDLEVELAESWYIFPIPIFDLADRNFNVWWKDHNASLERVNYGLRFVYVNFSGNKDNLKLHLQGGYTRKVLLQYERPYFNRAKTLGVTGRFFFDHRREYTYETRFNQQQFYPNPEEINYRSTKGIVSFHYRPKVQSFHDVLIKYEHTRVSDPILELNPFYFNGATKLQFIELAYTFRRERRNNRFYALSGNFIEAEIQKEGIGIFDGLNKLNTSLLYVHYQPITPGINLEMLIKGQREWTRNRHPYYSLQALGYGDDFLKGYELYVIDGTDFLLSKNALRFKIFSRTYDLKKMMPLRTYRIFPISVWITLNADIGRANNYLFNEENPFNNRWLFGKGFGLDIILYQKYVFQIEYSFNHLNEKGLFLNVKSDL